MSNQFKLGRHVEHDPRSRDFEAKRAPQIQTVSHKRHGKVFDQGQLGSCTGNAMAGALMTDPLWETPWDFNENTAVELYEAATKLDNISGSYPPDDTGSSGLAVCKAAKQAKYINAYHHAFGIQHALEALTLQPVIAGIPWYQSMFDPKPVSEGVMVVEIDPDSQVAGGHEIALLRIDVDSQLIGFDNSWGTSWGSNGSAWMTYATLERLLNESGDITVPVRTSN